MNNKTLSYSPSTVLTKNLIIDGVPIRLNFSDGQNPDTFENIRKTLLQTHQTGKKIAQIQ